MTHARQQIRERLETILTGLATTGANVTASRVYPVADADLPHLAIYTQEEEIDEDAGVMGDKEFRLLTAIIEARAKKTADLDDQLDTIALEVELAIVADSTLNGLAKGSELVATVIEMDDTGNQPTGLMRLAYKIRYRIDRTDPETIIT